MHERVTIDDAGNFTAVCYVHLEQTGEYPTANLALNNLAEFERQRDLDGRLHVYGERLA